MKKTLVVFHSADYDGIFCREIAKRFLPAGEGFETTYIGWNFGDPAIPVPPDGEVLVMDLPLDRPFGFMFGAARGNKEQMEAELAQQHGKDLERFTWIDHHKSAIETHPTNVPGFRIDGVAACRLAYAWLFRQTMFPHPEEEPLPTKENFINREVTEPIAVRLAGEYDVWDRRDFKALTFQFGLRAFELDGLWPRLLHLDESESVICPIIEAGIYCERYSRHVDASTCEHRSFLLEWEGLRWLCLNSARFNSLSFAARDTREAGHDALLGFCWDGKCWQVSMYHAAHNTNIDLSEIAKKYGGGGHRGGMWIHSQNSPFTIMNDETAYAWAAGLFDGEGCICIERYRPGRKCGERSVKFRFRIRVGMTSPQPILRLREIFGFGAISTQERKNGWKRKFTWAIEGERAARAVTLMLPYFTVKQREGQLGLEFMEFQRRSVPASTGCKGATYATLQERQRFYEAMLVLKVSRKKNFKVIPLPAFELLHRIRSKGINQPALMA